MLNSKFQDPLTFGSEVDVKGFLSYMGVAATVVM